jgi:hypothetical protein
MVKGRLISTDGATKTEGCEGAKESVEDADRRLDQSVGYRQTEAGLYSARGDISHIRQARSYSTSRDISTTNLILQYGWDISTTSRILQYARRYLPQQSSLIVQYQQRYLNDELDSTVRVRCLDDEPDSTVRVKISPRDIDKPGVYSMSADISTTRSADISTTSWSPQYKWRYLIGTLTSLTLQYEWVYFTEE